MMYDKTVFISKESISSNTERLNVRNCPRHQFCVDARDLHV